MAFTYSYSLIAGFDFDKPPLLLNPTKIWAWWFDYILLFDLFLLILDEGGGGGGGGGRGGGWRGWWWGGRIGWRGSFSREDIDLLFCGKLLCLCNRTLLSKLETRFDYEGFRFRSNIKESISNSIYY